MLLLILLIAILMLSLFIVQGLVMKVIRLDDAIRRPIEPMRMLKFLDLNNLSSRNWIDYIKSVQKKGGMVRTPLP